MIAERLLAVLQMADGLFPSGAFAHSAGLETYVQSGRVRDRSDVEVFLRALLEGSAGPCDAAAVAVAAGLAASGDVDGCLELDARLEVMKLAPELRAASAQMGRQTLRVAAAIIGDPLIDRLAGAAGAGAIAGHHALAFGAALGRRAVDPHTAACAYLHATATAVVNAALRLLPLGQIEGQRILAGAQPVIAKLAAAAATATMDDLWSFAPGLEIAAIQHAALTARMFRS
jgi:urease accessory protein